MDGQVYSEVSLTNSLDFHQSTSELGDNLNSSIVDPTGIGTHQKFDKDPLALEPQYHGKEQQSSGRSTQELEFGNENPEFSTTLQTTPSISDEENGRHKEFINLQTPGFRRSTNDEAENLTVNDVNDGPVASDDVGSGDEDSVISGNVLSNDSDVDGTIEVQNTGIFDTDHGSITVNADGSYEYTPGADYNGSDSFDVTIVDDDGATSTSTINLTVNDVNDGPVASDDVGSGDEDSVISGNVLSNDSDVDGTIEVQNTGIFDTDHGSITVNADGSYEYETMAWSGTLSFDTSEAELSVVATGQEDTAISLNIQSALSDSSETHTILIMDVPEGSEISAGTDNGDVTWSLSPEDLVGLTITPPKEFSGSFDLTIAAQSADGDDIATTTETLRVVVSDVNDGLVASDDDNDKSGKGHETITTIFQVVQAMIP